MPESNDNSSDTTADATSGEPSQYGDGSLWTDRFPEVVLLFVILVLAVVSMGVGDKLDNPLDSIQALLFDPDSLHGIVAREIRLPRTLIALVVGASLGLTGAALQGLLQNPLASPGLVGSASGAALGAIIVLYYFQSVLPAIAVPVAGMLGSLVTTFMVYVLAGRGAGIATLILGGVAVNAFAAALMSLMLNLAPSPYAVQEIVLWTLGDLSDRSLADLWLLLPPTLLGWLLLVGTGRALDAMTLGQATATSLGVQASHLTLRIFIAVALAVGAAVSTCGMIGFVGLVVPHLLRPLAAWQPARLLPLSALGGGIMVLLADLITRLTNHWFELASPIRIGVLTALVGAPFFLLLILKQRRGLGY